MTRPALVLQHGPLGPPGVLGDWLADRRIPMTVHRADRDRSCPDPREFAFVACLGSRFGPHDAAEPSVAAGRACLEQAVEHDVPVLGLCFGGQLLASVLGGDTVALERPELGWHTVKTDDPERVPAGPWLQWHWHAFTTPPGAVEVARSQAAPQAFRHGPHLGVQFHPESTIEIVRRWAEHDRHRLSEVGVPDGAALLEEGRRHAEEAAANAGKLFDGFWTGAREEGGDHGAP